MRFGIGVAITMLIGLPVNSGDSTRRCNVRSAAGRASYANTVLRGSLYLREATSTGLVLGAHGPLQLRSNGAGGKLVAGAALTDHETRASFIEASDG